MSSEPQQTWADPSSVCNRPLSPMDFDAYFLWLIRDRFARPDEQFLSKVHEYTWNSDPTESNIAVEDAEMWWQNHDRLPAVVVRAGPLETQDISIGGIEHGSGTDEVYHQDIVKGTYLIAGLSTNPKEAKLLGWYPWRMIKQLGRVIRKDLGMLRLQVGALSQLQKVKDLPDVRATSFQIEFHVSDRWAVSKIGPPLKRVGVIPTTE